MSVLTQCPWSDVTQLIVMAVLGMLHQRFLLLQPGPGAEQAAAGWAGWVGAPGTALLGEAGEREREQLGQAAGSRPRGMTVLEFGGMSVFCFSDVKLCWFGLFLL